MIKKHGHTFWLDLRVSRRRIRRSLKTGERAQAIERARDISRELQEEYARKDIRISDFVHVLSQAEVDLGDPGA